LQKHYSTFPGGRLGVGLLILRTTVGIATVFFGGILISRLGALAASQVLYLLNLVLGLMLLSGGILLILGLVTPSAAITVTGCQIISALIRLTAADPPQGKRFGWIAPLVLAGITIALFFVGPGGYSIDARIYGRRRILIPSAKDERNKES
jgi:uncharacterized membrane protein YphA (DoxX/SURF4 family)